MPPRMAAARMDAVKQQDDPDHQDVHQAIADADSHDKAERALEVVRELHKRYEAQDQRWHNYSKLIGFVCFAGLLLAVLYLQRDAHILYQVHSTIASSVLPDPEAISSPADVLNWLKEFLQKTWVDPACGDGLCESPFEFASYGRFGCRADCGRLSEAVENLTTVQIDLQYNFEHPAGSIPATELMSQALWNLCPENGAPHGRDCYYEEDRTFDRIEGSTQEIIDDVPDGLWTIKVKRDFFHKVKGAVRIRDLVETQAREYTKIWVALESAKANHAYEVGVLVDVITLAKTPLADLMRDTLGNEVDERLLNLQAQLQSNSISQAEHDTAVTELGTYRARMMSNLDARGACPVLLAYNYPGYPSTGAVGTVIPADEVYSSSIGGGAALVTVELDPPAGSLLTYNDLLPNGGPQCDASCVCDKLDEVAAAAKQARFDSMQTQLVNRLDRNSGRLGAQKARKLELMKEIIENELELYDFIIDLSTGLEPLSNPEAAVLDDVIAVYVNGRSAYGVDGQPNVVDSMLKRTPIMELNITADPDAIGVLVDRCQARRVEIAGIQTEVASLPAVQRVNEHMVRTAGDIKAVNYTISAWVGGSDAFNYCNLDTRADPYNGVCTDAIPYTLTSVDTAPYACLNFPNGTTLTASDCIAQVDHQLDCRATCECITYPEPGQVERGCGDTGYCTCGACEQLSDASEDEEYASIEATLLTTPPTGRRLMEMVEEQQERRQQSTRRRLQQLSTETVNQLLDSVNSLRTSQEGLRTQVSSLSTQVQEANQAAEERAQDKTLENLINAGRQDILLGQARVESLLAQIIGKQNQALAAAEQAQAAVQAISDLQERQAEAVTSVNHATQEQLTAIKQAAQQSLITLPQALVLWKRARRDREKALKNAILSNSACTTERVETHDFEVDNYEDVDLSTARERLIGLTNRIIAGILIHTTRMSYDDCDGSRFSKIESNCASGVSKRAYGVDPVFVMGSTLFDADLDNVRSLLLHYNCSQIPQADQVYNLVDPFAKTESFVNLNPFCANLYNMRNVPFGFFHHPLSDKPDGFPVWFDINLSEDQAQYWYRYLEEGLMLDVLTKEMTAEMVTYNAELRMFSSVFVRFRFTDGGAIAVTYKLHTIRVELYSDSRDFMRLFLEILFAICVFTTALYQVKGMHKAWVQTRRPLAYFTSAWTWVGLASTALMVTSNIVWWTFVLKHVPAFDIDIRYDVYKDLNAQARILDLDGDGGELWNAYSAFSNLQFLVQTLSWYYALNGINILLVIARILNLMHFQPRLGVVTRSLLLAGPDLLHFTVVAGIVFVGYAMMAHVIFGNVIEKFSTFQLSIDTCFEMLLGEIGVNEDLKALTGLQGLAGSLFFWTFELLVFMVLLNFLLAIIVDAFSVVKDNTAESTGLHEELGQMMREKWRAMLGRMLNVHYIPSHRLSALLKHWAGTDLEEAKTKPADDKLQKKIRVMDHDLEETDLQTVLMEAMHTMMGDIGDTEPDEEQGSKCCGQEKKRKADDGMLSSEELESAAKWLIDRFGHDEESEEEDTEEEDDEGAKYSEEALERERDALAKALERLATVQRELALGQHELMSGQRALAEQQDKLVQFLESPFDEAVAALNAEQQQAAKGPAPGSAVGPDLVQMSQQPWGFGMDRVQPVAPEAPPTEDPPSDAVRATRTVQWGSGDNSNVDDDDK